MHNRLVYKVTLKSVNILSEMMKYTILSMGSRLCGSLRGPFLPGIHFNVNIDSKFHLILVDS